MSKKIEDRYHRAEKLLAKNLRALIKNTKISPKWVPGIGLWFRRELTAGYEFILLEIAEEKLLIKESPIFDHSKIAIELTRLLDVQVSKDYLPIVDIIWEDLNNIYIEIEVETESKIILVDLSDYTCVVHKIITSSIIKPGVRSPDGKWNIVLEDHNLFLEGPADNENNVQITHDGENLNSYSSYICFPDLLSPLIHKPAVSWSADSKYAVLQQTDLRNVEKMSLIQAAPIQENLRPIIHTYPMALPGDNTIPRAILHILDAAKGHVIKVNYPPFPIAAIGPLDNGMVWWGEDQFLYMITVSRDNRDLTFLRVDPENGSIDVLVEEHSESFLTPSPFFYICPPLVKILPSTNEFIWYSQWQGWGQIVLHDLATGKIKNSITTRQYTVTWIHHVDLINRFVYFSAGTEAEDSNPFYQKLYRVSMDGGGLHVLTPECCHHNIPSPVDEFYTSIFAQVSDNQGFSADGKTFVDTMSTLSQPSESVLRSSIDGSILARLTASDPSSLEGIPWSLPLAFSAKAADSKTDLWGAIFKPSDFSKNKSYPVILVIYGAPQVTFSPKSYGELDSYMGGTFWSLAELGFVVVALDPRGTPLRSKSIQDYSYQNLQNGGGIDDQVAALKNSSRSNPWMDLDRVGIAGYSGGGFAAARAMLSHADFFKVAVSAAGNHDQRLFISWWGETFQGPYDHEGYKMQASSNLSANLRGKLLLVHGDLDTTVNISATMQLADSLIKNNRDFDLLILPNRGHFFMDDPYFIRRTWDYFVTHLLGEVPPNNYKIESNHAT